MLERRAQIVFVMFNSLLVGRSLKYEKIHICSVCSLPDQFGKGEKMYAIKNTKTNKWVRGTDYRYSPYHQFTSNQQALTWESEAEANLQFKHRRCGKNYKVVELELS